MKNIAANGLSTSGLESLAVEGEAVGEASAAELVGLPSVTSLSLRCADLPTVRASPESFFFLRGAFFSRTDR